MPLGEGTHAGNGTYEAGRTRRQPQEDLPAITDGDTYAQPLNLGPLNALGMLAPAVGRVSVASRDEILAQTPMERADRRRFGAAIDADLQYVQTHRLSGDNRNGIVKAFFGLEGFEDHRYLGCFEGGYAWGRQKDITWYSPSDERMAEIDAAIADVDKLEWSDEQIVRETIIATVFQDALPELADGMATVIGTPGFESADDAFDATHTGASAEGFALDPNDARSVFHVGSAFVAFETKYLLSQRLDARFREAQRGASRSWIDSLVVTLNLVLALALGAGVVWLGHRWLETWWTLIATIPIALSILGAWARWSEGRDTEFE